MTDIGKSLILIGGVILVIGVVLTFSGKVPFLGKLPGDIYVKKENFTFYFPLTTSILLSVVLSAILFLFSKK